MRKSFLYISLLLSFQLHGQIYFNSDTIKINEVIIRRNKVNIYPSGYKIITLDSSVLQTYSNKSLSDILYENSKIFIKSYGMGGTATPTFRGTSAGHTQIAWNDININHPMLGQSDLSLLPAGLIDEIQIYYGGASMAVNSGGIGGIINLETKPAWRKETVTTINPGLGSFGRYTGLIKVKTGNSHFQSVTKAFYHYSENDFRYLNTEISSLPVWEKRSNNQVRQKAFLQELFLRRKLSTISARLWYQSANRNIPPSMLTQQLNSDEKQYDESLRTMINYDLSHGVFNYYFTGAFMSSRLNYINSIASVDSRNLSETYVLKTVLESRRWEKIKFKMTLNEEVSIVKSNNYIQNATHNIFSFTASAENLTSGRFGTSILIREILENNSLLIPDFSTALQFRVVDDREYFVKANFSRNSKMPSMNDMYWLPGGNPDLKNEYAFIYELGFDMVQKISVPLYMQFDLALFHNNIRDMIFWLPGEYSYWTSDNIKNVITSGLESSVTFTYNSDKLTSRLVAGYSFTSATSESKYDNNQNSAGKQLMYIPKHQGNLSVRFGYGRFYSSWTGNYTGRRFITMDNSKYLKGYFLNNMNTGFKLINKVNTLDINFNIENIFNINYQTIVYYPLPGRSYTIKVMLQIVK